MELEVRLLDPRLGQGFELPAYATDGSAGMDLRACIDAPLELPPGRTELVSSGIAIHLSDPGWTALIVPRSGLGSRHGVVLGNLVGVIDSDYQGPLLMPLWNRAADSYVIQPGERVAQLLIVPVARARLRIVDAFSPSSRGTGGFGSTGQR